MANRVVVNFAETDELSLSDPCPLFKLGVCDRGTASAQSREAAAFASPRGWDAAAQLTGGGWQERGCQIHHCTVGLRIEKKSKPTDSGARNHIWKQCTASRRVEVAGDSDSQHESKGEKTSNNERSEEQQWLCSESKGFIPLLPQSCCPLQKIKAKVTIKFCLTRHCPEKARGQTQQQSWAFWVRAELFLHKGVLGWKSPRLSGTAHSTGVMDRWAQHFHCEKSLEIFSPPSTEWPQCQLKAEFQSH